MAKTKILIYDSITDGHHPDYLFHLVNYINSKSNIEAFVASGEDFFNDYLKHPTRKNIVWNNHIHFLPIAQLKIESFVRQSKLKRSISEYQFFLELGKKHEVNHAILMYADYLQLGILVSAKPSFTVSGIIFRPTFHLEVNGLFNTTYKNIKALLLKSVLKKSYISNMYALDSSVISFWGNESKLAYINEPISAFPISKSSIDHFKNEHQISAHQQVFLNFGYLDDRKGIDQFLKACRLLPEAEAQKICLILAGNISASYQAFIEKQIEKTPHIRVITFFKYLDQTEYQILFEASDVVLMLYQKHIGMSSVLVRAAAVHKPVLLENFGILSSIAEKYQLGKLVQSKNSEKLKNDLLEVLHNGIRCDFQKQSTFANNNTPEAFAEKLVGNYIIT